jgi:MinD superfamily P-loop ATPase
MKEVVIVSGKGGTGKTSLVAAFASLAEKQVLCDADVDAADLHLILKPEVREQHDFKAGHTARINPDKCTRCGECRELCRWSAISADFQVDPIECEGCGVCVHFCPAGAVDFPENTCGRWYISDTRFGVLVHARLGIAEENSGKLVTLVRQKAKEIALQKDCGLILTDGPPGVGCPVIAAIGGAAAILIIAEPTIAGEHDMQRVSQLANHFQVPAMLCVNKFDINFEKTKAIEQSADESKIRNLGRVPFDPLFTRSMVEGKNIFEFDGDSSAARAVRRVWRQAQAALGI